MKMEKGTKFARIQELKTVLWGLRMTPIETLGKKSPFELYFGRKPNTEWRLITTKPDSKNLNKYSISDSESILDMDKIIIQDDEDSLIQESSDKRAQQETPVVNIETGSESDDAPLCRAKKRTPKTKCVVKTRPKKAGKTLVTDITNKIKSWSTHTVTLRSGKVIRKSDVYKYIDPWPETSDPVANRQLIRQAACKTVKGRKRLDQVLKKDETWERKGYPSNVQPTRERKWWAEPNSNILESSHHYVV